MTFLSLIIVDFLAVITTGMGSKYLESSRVREIDSAQNSKEFSKASTTIILATIQKNYHGAKRAVLLGTKIIKKSFQLFP
ncbi:hypothetical protein CQ025_14935 [Pseudomonas sp. MYb3]|nr:hypothetical protein CQ025_14935 [Pseudomonas sp. MYb3]